jgi:hypothetical protein
MNCRFEEEAAFDAAAVISEAVRAHSQRYESTEEFDEFDDEFDFGDDRLAGEDWQ